MKVCSTEHLPPEVRSELKKSAYGGQREYELLSEEKAIEDFERNVSSKLSSEVEQQHKEVVRQFGLKIEERIALIKKASRKKGPKKKE